MNTYIKKGLTREEVVAKQKKFGLNEVEEKKESLQKRFLKKLWGPIPWMIEIAAILSFFLKDWVDFVIIAVLLIVNVVVDFLQESKAVNALEMLKSQLAQKAIVYRDGKWESILSRELVPDDIIKLKSGDIVPADAKLLEGEYLSVDQSALTGESLAVHKKKGEEVFSGSIIKQGEMIAQVTATGLHTFSGKNIELISQAESQEQSHFQKAILRIGKFLIVLSSLLAILILLVSVLRHDSLVEDLRFVLVLLIASIPVALPAVLSVTMAVGALQIAKKKAIVRNLSAIEELAGTDVLCSDKTGTLTQNKLTLGKSILYNHFTEKDLLQYAVLASQKENMDPIEIPIFNKWEREYPNEDITEWKLQSFQPFDPITKYTKGLFKKGKDTISILKGASQVLLQKLDSKEKQERVLSDTENFAKKGYRSLAIGFEKNGKFEIVGLLSFFDPPREDSSEVIQKVKDMGVRIKMITGDNQAIAKEIASILHIGGNIFPIKEMRSGDFHKEQKLLAKIIGKGIYKKLNGSVSEKEVESFGEAIAEEVGVLLDKAEIQDNYIIRHESEIIDLIEKSDGFSEVLPADKYFIIESLQKNNHFVAMTGDGVNDAPALKKADIGIAVSGATEAARSASDIVLLEPGLSIIEEAIVMARKTFERMKGYATFRIAETIRIILFMSLSILIFNFYPVTSVMIILLALLNDIPVMMIAYDNAPQSDKPVHWNMREVLTISLILGIAGVVSSFLLFFFLESHNYPLAVMQTILFLKFDVAGHSTLYLTRTGRKHFWEKPYPALKFFLPAFSTRIIGTLLAVYGIFMEPISWKIVGIIWIYSFVWWIFNDFLKVWAYKILDKINK